MFPSTEIFTTKSRSKHIEKVLVQCIKLRNDFSVYLGTFITGTMMHITGTLMHILSETIIMSRWASTLPM